MTTTQLTVVEWADKVGKGFAPHRPAGAPTPPAEYWTAAQRLLEADVTQPPLRSTAPHPVWSLRHVEVGRLGGHWCFAVQGRGDSFGVAGTCRFAFAPGQEHPGRVWRDAADLVGAAQLSTPDDLTDRVGSSAGQPSPDVLRTVLAGLALNSQHIRVPGAPAEVAAAIGALLDVLPRRLVRSRTWSTCLLQRPDPQAPIVAGELPEEFRRGAAGLARQLDQIRWAPAPPQDRLLAALKDRRRVDALESLTRAAGAGQPDDTFDGPFTTLVELLDHIVEHHLTLTVDDVPALVKTSSGAARLHRHPGLVQQWASERPREALTHQQRLTDPALRQELVRGLVDAQLTSADNLWLLPLGDRPAGLLREHSADPDQRAATVRALKAAHPVFTHAVDQPTAQSWLRQLDLSPWQHPDLFPDRATVIADDLMRDGVLTQDIADDIAARYDDHPDLARAVGSKSTGLSASTAAALIAVFPPFSQRTDPDGRVAVRQVARAVTLGSVPTRQQDAERWVAQLLFELMDLPARMGVALSPRAVRNAMYGALEALSTKVSWRRLGPRHLKEGQLVDLCTHIGVYPDAPDVVRSLLPDSATVPLPANPPASAQPPIYVPQRDGAGPGKGTYRIGADPDPASGPARPRPAPPTSPAPASGRGEKWRELAGWRGRDKWLVPGIVAVVATGAVGTTIIGYAQRTDSPQTQQTHTTTPAPIRTTARSGPVAGESAEILLHLEGALEADEQKQLASFKDQLAQHSGGRRVAAVQIVALERREDAGLTSATRLRELLKQQPELSGAHFEDPGWRQPAGAVERPGDLKVTVIFAAQATGEQPTPAGGEPTGN